MLILIQKLSRPVWKELRLVLPHDILC